MGLCHIGRVVRVSLADQVLLAVSAWARVETSGKLNPVDCWQKLCKSIQAHME